MQFIMFTKHLEGLDVAGVIEALTGLGLKGADLCVRPGYPVHPQNMARALPQAARQFAEAGLQIPLVTAPGDFTRPDMEYAERFYAACGEAGVRHIKLGYWHWSPERHYWINWIRFAVGSRASRNYPASMECRAWCTTIRETRWV